MPKLPAVGPKETRLQTAFFTPNKKLVVSFLSVAQQNLNFGPPVFALAYASTHRRRRQAAPRLGSVSQSAEHVATGITGLQHAPHHFTSAIRLMCGVWHTNKRTWEHGPPIELLYKLCWVTSEPCQCPVADRRLGLLTLTLCKKKVTKTVLFGLQGAIAGGLLHHFTCDLYLYTLRPHPNQRSESAVRLQNTLRELHPGTHALGAARQGGNDFQCV